MHSRQALSLVGALCTLALSACDSPLKPIEALIPALVPAQLVGTACPNEPAGWTLVSDRHFLPLAKPIVYSSGREMDAGWISSGGFALIADASAPDGDGWVGQERYTIANRVGNGTMSSWIKNDFVGKKYSGLYTCYMTKVDPNYVGEASAVNKQFWFQVGTNLENRVLTLLHIPGSPVTMNSAAFLATRYQNLDNKPASSAIFSSKMPVSRGAWHRYEMQAQLETSKGAADGWIKTYSDGVLATTTTGLRFTHPSEVLEWKSVKWNNTYGGGSAFCTTKSTTTGLLPTQLAHPECFVPHTQYVWTDAQRVLAH